MTRTRLLVSSSTLAACALVGALVWSGVARSDYGMCDQNHTPPCTGSCCNSPPPPPGGAPPPSGGGNAMGNNENTGGPSVAACFSGDPVSMTNGNTFFRRVDAIVPTTTGQVAIAHSYSSSSGNWNGLPGGNNDSEEESGTMTVPHPFGADESGSSIKWWSSLYSRVHTDGTYWQVHELDGHWMRFTPCTVPNDGGVCWATDDNNSLSLRDRLQAFDGGFVFFKDNGLHAYYGQGGYWGPHGGSVDRYFLTKLESPQYGDIATIQYAAPSSTNCTGSCTNCPASGVGDAGVPYIYSVTTEDGTQLLYKYTALNGGSIGLECVLTSIALDGGGTIVSYTYTLDGGVQAPGFLASATWYDAGGQVARVEDYTYQYVDNGGEIFDGFQATQLSYNITNSVLFSSGTSEGGVQTDTSEDGESITINGYGMSQTCPVAGSGSCGGGNSCEVCLPNSCYTNTATDANAQRGDGKTGGVSLVRTFYSANANEALNDPIVGQFADSCTGLTQACAAGTKVSEWTQCFGGADPPPYDFADKDYAGNWVVKTVEKSTLGGSTPTFPQLTELTEVQAGATNDQANTPLETTNFSYQYGATNSEQQVDAGYHVSNYGGSLTAATLYSFDTNNRMTRKIEQGCTDTWNGSSWATTCSSYAYRGTFYFDKTVCSGSGTADALHRNVEVHGPCWVAGTTSTDCDVNQTSGVPITQYIYWSATGTCSGETTTAANANKLCQVIQYPTNSGPTSCSSGLTTHFLAYDARGNLTKMKDPNGVVTTFTYEEDRITQKAVTEGSTTLTTNYTYDNGKLTTVQYPSSGFYEVFCFRSGTTSSTGPSGCTGGTWTTHLQWKAKATNATGSSWTEAIVYSYWPDEEMQSEEYFVNDGSSTELRRIVEHQKDAQRRPTWDAFGDGGGSYAATHGFDLNDNPNGVGLPYNSPPPWCLVPGSSTPSTLCTQLTYNRTSRLGYFDLFPDGGSGSDIATCVDRDHVGNITEVSPGCTGPGSTACNGFNVLDGVSTCSNAPLTYKTDDFGNLVEATLPWTSNGSSAAGTTHYEFDALGDVIVKQTPVMVANSETLQYTFDQLGRLTSSSDFLGATGTTLYTLSYDSANAASTLCGQGCQGTAPSTANANGRLALRNDNFGLTWYVYDLEGRVIEEERLRDGGGSFSCSSGYEDPTTTYSYNANGVLTCITNPYQRKVSYTLSSIDRPTTVTVELFTDAGNQNQNLITSAAWEPYGGLRAYQVNTPDGGAASVEYMLGDDGAKFPGNGSSSPANCSFALASASSTDYTGRVRTLAVHAGTQTLPLTKAELYKVGYKWQGDQLVESDTCLLDGGEPRTERYVYDELLRLTSATNPDGGGAFTTRGYEYDSRSNLSKETIDSCTRTPNYGGYSGQTSAVDLLNATGTCGSPNILEYSYTFGDDDGRVTNKAWPNDSSGGEAWGVSVAYGPTILSTDDTVFKSATVGNSGNSTTYNYYIDAFGRRRLKVYPVNTVSDEYFQSVDNRLLVDQGNDSSTSPASHPMDEYVWLGGRPVVIVRGHMDTSWNRLYDFGTAGCSRYGDGSNCQAYFTVSDNIGKPVLVIDSRRKVAGEADYEPFGYPNRVLLDSETAHPDTGNNTLGPWKQPALAKPMQVDFRALFGLLDNIPASGTCGQTAVSALIEDASNSSTLYTSPSGSHVGRVVSNWVSPAQSTSTTPGIKVVDNGTSTYKADVCNPTCSCQTLSTPFTGAAMEAYEYRTYQADAGATPYWPSLRFPGQYYDAETDLMENWNRYYDPQIGRYLQPDSLLAAWKAPNGDVDLEGKLRNVENLSPDEKRRLFNVGLERLMSTGSGREWLAQTVPDLFADLIQNGPYEYARDNPLSFTDVDGDQHSENQCEDKCFAMTGAGFLFWVGCAFLSSGGGQGGQQPNSTRIAQGCMATFGVAQMGYLGQCLIRCRKSHPYCEDPSMPVE